MDIDTAYERRTEQIHDSLYYDDHIAFEQDRLGIYDEEEEEEDDND